MSKHCSFCEYSGHNIRCCNSPLVNIVFESFKNIFDENITNACYWHINNQAENMSRGNIEDNLIISFNNKLANHGYNIIDIKTILYKFAPPFYYSSNGNGNRKKNYEKGLYKYLASCMFNFYDEKLWFCNVLRNKKLVINGYERYSDECIYDYAIDICYYDNEVLELINNGNGFEIILPVPEIINRKSQCADTDKLKNCLTKIKTQMRDCENECVDCSICLENVNKNKFIKFNCSHEFCEDCVTSLFNKNLLNCALCRKSITDLSLSVEN